MKKNNVYKSLMSASPAIDAEYLIAILHLKSCEFINQVEISKDFDSNTASIIRVCIHITSENNQTIKKLFIKAAKPDSKNNAYHDKSMREVSFYRFLLSHQDIDLPVPNCYDAYSSEEVGEFFIILEDLSDNYSAVSDSDLMNENIWFCCAESLAKFHAAFWNDPQLIKDEKSVMSEQKTESKIRSSREYLNRFLKEFQDTFDEKTIRIFEHALEINNTLIREPTERSHITVCNGDSHIYNFMVPYDNSNEPVITDFQFWGNGLGTGDLAHLTRVNFSDELKKTIQIPLIKRYYETLQKYGVKNYSWEECLNNYRREVASMVLIPMWQFCCFGLKYEEWIGDVEGLIFNYECMNCEEIISEYDE